MYSKFKVNQDSFLGIGLSDLDTVKGKSLTTNYKNDVSKVIEEKFKENKFIDGSKIQEEWFPKIQCDVFISHSHKDLEKAKQFAGWLKNKFNLNAFIDYNIWGSMHDLLKSIDDAYCYDKIKKTYSYEKRNLTTSHVHMMLLNALADMIDRTECLVFFETPNSINLKEMTHSSKSLTESPWIYNELFLSKIIQIKQRRANQELAKTRASIKMFTELNENFKPEYTVDLSHLIDLSSNDLKLWLELYKKPEIKAHSLDILYSLKNINVK